MAPDSNPDAVVGCISHSLFPQKKRKMAKNGKQGKGKNTKKVVPLGDEM